MTTGGEAFLLVGGIPFHNLLSGEATGYCEGHRYCGSDTLTLQDLRLTGCLEWEGENELWVELSKLFFFFPTQLHTAGF